MKLKRYIIFISALVLAVATMAASQPFKPVKSYTAPGKSTPLTTFRLDANASGVIHTINNIVDMTVYSRDDNDLKAEYRTGFIQGRLQGKTILSARDNSWDHL